jgi:hypothetical protein
MGSVDDMKVGDLINIAASNQPLPLADVESVAAEMDVSVPWVLDAFARAVAIQYLQGKISFDFADVAMTQLFGFAITDSGIGLSEFAWGVFEAFDEGEYIHEGMTDEEQGEALTRKLLGKIDSLGAA